MTHSHVRPSEAVADGMPNGSLVWFGASIDLNGPWPSGALPDGYLTSTARDMAIYLQFQLGDGTWKGHRIVSEAGLRRMHAPAVPTPPDIAAESTAHYGFGWAVGSLAGQDLLAHDGDATGYHANMALLPDTGRAIVVLSARNGLLTDPSSAYRAGLDALVGSAAAGSSSTFVRTYAVVDAVALLAVAAMVLSLLRRRRWAAAVPHKAARRGRWGAVAPTVLADVLLAVALYVGVFVGIGSPPLLFSTAPDVACVALLAVAFFAVKAVVDLCLGLAVLGRAVDRPPVQSTP